MSIALTLAALNYLPFKVVDIHNAYIAAPVTEKIWTVIGQEFGEYAGRKAIVVRELCGLKSAGSDFRNYLADCVHHLGLLPCPSDLDLCMKPVLRSEDGFNYYAYVLIYFYCVMVIHNDADSVLRQIYKYFKLNPSSIGDPDIYMRDKLKKM